MKTTQRGFTIVELLVVIVVIAILATISIVSYNGIQQRARAAALSSALSQSTKAVALYYAEKGTYPPDLATVGVNDTADTSYQYSVNNNASTPTYCITATTGTTSYKAGSDQTTAQPGGCAGHGVGGVAAITNLIPDPGFEGSYWPINGNMAGYSSQKATNIKLSGDYSFSITGPATVADAYIERYIPVTPGTYSFSAWVYLTGNGATSNNRDIWFHCGTMSCPGSPPDPTYDRTKLNQWQRVTKTQPVANAGSIRIRFYGPVSSTTYFDNFMMTATNTPQNYADGSSPNWIWNGTPNNSTSTGPPL